MKTLINLKKKLKAIDFQLIKLLNFQVKLTIMEI